MLNNYYARFKAKSIIIRFIDCKQKKIDAIVDIDFFSIMDPLNFVCLFKIGSKYRKKIVNESKDGCQSY